MKKICVVTSILVLSGCYNEPRFYPYEGDISVKGDGGFVEDYISVDDIAPQGLFVKVPDYKYEGVAFFLSGLPKGENCTLYGYMTSTRDSSFENRQNLARKILEINANTATMSSISAPIQLANGKGTLGNGVSGLSSANRNAYGTVVSVNDGYNIFECK